MEGNFHTSGIHTKQAHVKIPEGLYEEEHGRKGFFGKVSHLYHENPPVNWSNIEGDLKPRSLPNCFNLSTKTERFETLLENQDLKINVGEILKDQKPFSRHGDCDQLFFIHKGQGEVETTYGVLPYKEGDYLIIPRGTTYKFFIKEKTQVLSLESYSEFEQPDRGPLGPNALYDQSALFIPMASVGREKEGPFQVQITRGGRITTVTYPFNPLDVKGWKGSVYPFKLSIYDFCPIMSHKYHIPPSGHTTFVARNFVVCSFVARPLESSKEGVLKVPFYHSNIDFDEVLFYHRGNFFSRDQIDAGALTYHPGGIHHGPHPNAFKASMDKTETDEFAVMIDARNPLNRTSYFKDHENQNYFKSWSSL